MGRAYCEQSSCCDEQLTLANIRHEKVGSQRDHSRPWAVFLQAKDRLIRCSQMGVPANSRGALTPAPTALNSQNFPLFPETKCSTSSFIHPVQSLQCGNEHIQFLPLWQQVKHSHQSQSHRSKVRVPQSLPHQRKCAPVFSFLASTVLNLTARSAAFHCQSSRSYDQCISSQVCSSEGLWSGTLGWRSLRKRKKTLISWKRRRGTSL